jgi:hypothetical protein
MKPPVIALLCATTLSGGCATIVGDKTQLIPIDSDPELASVVIIDESGRQVFSGTTPTRVTLDKSDGSYWGGKSYTVTITKPGYASREIPVRSSANGWYIAGNLVFGGLIGWFIVDPFNGGMYTLTPKQIETELGQQSVREGSISIVLLEDVPDTLRAQMQSIE